MRALLAIVALALAAACSSPSRPSAEQQAALPGDHVVVIGDSYTMGPENNGEDPDAWPAIVWTDLRAKGYDIQPTVVGEGGSGYIHKGYRGGIFGDKVSGVQPSTDLIVFFGGANDLDIPPDVEKSTVSKTFKAARLAAPKANMLVIGPAWPRESDVPPEVWKVRDIIRDEAAVIGAKFVDPLAEKWLWNDPSLIGADWIHPNRAGQKYLADKILPLIQAELPPPTKH